MRIGIDLRSLEDGAQHRGIGRYATELIETLSGLDHDNEYVFLLSKPSAVKPKLTLNKKFTCSYVYGSGWSLRSVKYVRIMFLLPKPLAVDRFGLDVVLQIDTSQRIKARRTPVVSVIYDLIPFIYKDLYQHVHRGGYTPGHLIGYSRMKLRWKALERQIQDYKNHARVISISEHSKRDLVKWVPRLKSENVVAIPLAAGQLPAVPTKIPERLNKLGLKNFLFYVGGADPRKGLAEFVGALEELWSKDPETQVVIAGKDIVAPDLQDAIKLRKVINNLSRADQVITPGYMSDGELAWLYAHARAFVFPSRYEGFGLPILEAMQAGCPVVTYDNSSISEVAGEAALLVPDGESMVPALHKVMSDESLRQDLIKKGKARAKQFNWEKTAKETLTVLMQSAKDKRS
ncbi:MAG: glycosyltransferase family 1 protein [Patescibacteria group bacterium]